MTPLNTVDDLLPPVMNIPEWEKYIGYNEKEICISKIQMAGKVDINRHIGKLLSTSLWQDLKYRLLMSSLCIYRGDIKFVEINNHGHCDIFLDSNDIVKNINFIEYYVSCI